MFTVIAVITEAGRPIHIWSLPFTVKRESAEEIANGLRQLHYIAVIVASGE